MKKARELQGRPVISDAGRIDGPTESGETEGFGYVPIRRLKLYIENCLTEALQSAGFDPDRPDPWGVLKSSAEEVLQDMFERGLFAGTAADQAYIVKCGPETMTQTDVDNGVVNVVVGFAPLRPAEFVFMTIQTMMDQSEERRKPRSNLPKRA